MYLPSGDIRYFWKFQKGGTPAVLFRNWKSWQACFPLTCVFPKIVNEQPKLTSQNWLMASPSKGSCPIKSEEGTPIISKLCSLNVSYRVCREANCLVRPHFEAMFTIIKVLPLNASKVVVVPFFRVMGTS